MASQTQSLRWGDLVRIHGVNITNQEMPKGLIIAKGFTDSNIYYQTYSKFDDVNFYRQSLFQILPKSNFDLHDQYLKYIQTEKNKQPQKKQYLKNRAAVEIQNLNSQLQAKAGKQIIYGAEVVFKHVQSQEYLCGVLKAADIGQGAFKLQLKQNLCSQIIFQIKSHRTYQHDGNNVYYDDCLQLYHVKSDCYVNFPPDTQNPTFLDRIKKTNQNPTFLDRTGKNHQQTDKFKKDQAAKYLQKRPKIKRPKSVRIPIINQNKSKCLWKFINHCSYSDYLSKQKIKSHDIVYFEHTQNKGLVASTLADKKYYLKQPSQQNKNKGSEGPSYECFWQLIPKQVNQFGPQSCNLFWARNIVTGQILTYGKQKPIQIQSKQAIEGGGFKSQGLINLIISENEKLQRGQPIPIPENTPKIQAYFQNKINKIQFKAVQILTQDSFIIIKVQDDTIRDVAYVLSSHQYLVKFVQIFGSKLFEMVRDGNKSKQAYTSLFLSMDEDFLKKLINILKLLCGKIYGTEYQEIQSSGNTPIPQIQKILVQTGIPQLLVEIIYLLFEPFQQIQRDNQPSQDKAIRLRLVEIFQISYKLLQKIANGFEDNRIYLSRWVDLFLGHSKKINKPFIQETLVCILQNNPVSIESTIEQSKIEQLIQSFIQQARPTLDNNELQLTTKYLRLFSTFIKCDDRVLKENQLIIFSKFFNKDDNQFVFKFKVQYRVTEQQENLDDPKSKQKSKIVKLSFGRDDYMSIPDFFENHRAKFNYLLAYINLLADVCMDRNNYAIQNVEFILPLSVVSAVLVDDQIINLKQKLETLNKQSVEQGQGILFPQTNIHEPFIRIAHHAYVNNEKFSPIKRVKKIRNWYKFYETEGPIQQDINKTKRVYEGEKQEEQKQYLKYIRDYIKEFLKNCDQQNNNLQILNTVLSLLKQTIILGLWDQIQDFRQMIPHLVMRILKINAQIFFLTQQNKKISKQEVQANKQKIKLNRPQIALLIDCKVKATQIFTYMNQMEIDIRLRYLMHFFQGLYDSTQNFQIYNIQEGQFDVDIEDQQQKQQITTRNSTAKEQFFKIFGSLILGDVKKISQDQDIMLKQNIWYNKLKKMIPITYTKQAEQTEYDTTSGGNRNLFKNSDSYDGIILSLFQLSGYQNKNLLNYSLKMLRAMFGQRKDLIFNFNQMLICGKGNLNQVYLTLKFMRNKFDILQNHSILKFDGNVNKSFPYAIWKPYDHLGRQQSKRSGIIQDLFFLARTLKDNVSLKNIQSLMHVQQQVFNPQIVYNFYNQRQKNNCLFQQLNMAEGIYIPLLQYIKNINRGQITEIHRRLLFSIYQYLTLLCFNNMKAKHILMKFIPDILKHLSKKVGAASLLYEICINNKLLVNNQELVRTILEGALKACCDLQNQNYSLGIIAMSYQDLGINNDYQKSRILYSLRGVLIFADQGHKRNQAMLMDLLQNNSYRRLVFTGTLNYSANKQKFDLSPPEAYAATHFQLFSSLVQSQNLINIGKLQNLHSYVYCLSCLQSTNRWQIRRSLRSYVNRLYYINKDKDIFMFQQFIRRQFTIINKQLNDLIDLHSSKMLTQDLKVKNGIRFVYALSDIILLIIQILITLHQMFLKPEFLKLLKKELFKQDKKQEKPLHNSLINLLTNLGSILLLYPKTKPIAPFIRQIKRLMTPILETLHVRYLEKQSEPKQHQQSKQQNVQQSQIGPVKKGYVYDHSRSFFRNLTQMIRDLKSKEKVERLKDQAAKRKNHVNMSEGQLKLKYIDVIFSVPGASLRPIFDRKINKQQELHYKPHLQTAHSKIFRVLAKPDLQQNEQNIELNKRLSSVKQLMEDAPIFKKLKDDQFYNLVKIFKNIDDTSTQFYKQNWQKNSQTAGPIYSRKQIIKNIFSLIMNNPNQISDNQKIFVIKLIRCYISQAVQEKQSYKLSVDKWDADYYTDGSSGQTEDDKKSELVRRQHQIQECGGSDFIISIFKQNLTDRVELLNQALLLGIVYLYNGNKLCQNSILKSLTADPQNLMLLSMKNIITFIGNFLIEVRKMKDYEKVRNFAYKSVDSYDHFNIQQKTLAKVFGHNSSDKFQIQTQLNFQLALCRSFRFLQLFCQSNNTSMKNFLLAQNNEDGSKKTNSINFVNQTCLLIRKLFKIMNNKVVGIPGALLNFINEITQIPCIQTQLSLLRSTFFEDISYMAGFFESKQNILQRKFNFVSSGDDDPLNQLFEIYEQGIGLAMSNFEGNDNQIVYQFISKAQPKYLWIVIKHNIVKMLKQKAAQWGVDRDQVDKHFDTDNIDKQSLRDFREFLTQQRYVKALFDAFNETKIKKLIQHQQSCGKTFRQQICTIINVISLLKKIDDYAAGRQKQALKDKQNPNLQENQKAIKARNFRINLTSYGKRQYKYFDLFMAQFQGLVLQIQVASNNGKQVNFQNLYFPNHPVFNYLAGDTKDTIMFEVSRDTQRDKLTSLLGYYDNIQQQIEWNYDMKYYNLKLSETRKIPLSITSNLINRIRDTARYVSYFICALMLYLIVVDHDTIEQTSYFTYYNYKDKLIMRIICGVQLTLTVLFFVLWLRMRSTLSYNKYMKDLQGEQQEGGQQQGAQQEEEDDNRDHWLAKLRIRLKPYHRRLNKVVGAVSTFTSSFKQRLNQNTFYRKIIHPIVQFFTKIFRTIAGLHAYQSGFLSILVFVSASFLGNFLGVQWYTMHLFDFFVGISLLTNVFKAILNNIKILGLLSGLAGCFILVFNVVSLNTYVSVIYQEQVPEEACQDFLGCVLQLYTSGAIGDDMDQLYVGRFLFDTLYVVFMEMIFQGLVGGIIIDAFMGLKQEDAVRDQDKKNKCYICSMTKPDMQKMGTTFKKHTQNSHFLWNYLFYMYCLKLKDQTDYTGLQYDITDKYANEDVTWFPDNGQKDMSGQIQELVEQLKENIEKMKQNSNALVQKTTSSFEKLSPGVRKALDKNNQLLKALKQQQNVINE